MTDLAPKTSGFRDLGFNHLLTVRARVDLIVVAAQENFFFHNSPKVVVGHGLKDYGVKNLFTM